MCGQEPIALKGHVHEVNSVVFSSDSHRLASAGPGSSVTLAIALMSCAANTSWFFPKAFWF